MDIKKIVYLSALVLLILISCDKKKIRENDSILKNSFSKFKTLKQNSNTINFKKKDSIVGIYKDFNTYSYIGSNKNKNTYVSFDVRVFEDNFYDLTEYHKTSIDSINSHFMELNNNQDTLYYFQMNRYYPRYKLFIVGKYNFYEKFGLFNKEQKSLYKKYKDSLFKVRGNVKLFEGLKG